MLTNAETFAFTVQIPLAYANDMTNWYPQVVDKVVANVQRKYGLSTAAAEDVAARAVTYSLSYFLNGKAPWPAKMSDWTALAQKKARYLALDACARAKKGPRLQVDAPASRGDNEPMPESGVVAAWSLQNWRDARASSEARARAAAVRAVLPQVVAAMDVKDARRVCIVFDALYFQGEPMDVVSRRHGITANYAYQIVHRVKAAYREFGRRLVARYLDGYEVAA